MTQLATRPEPTSVQDPPPPLENGDRLPCAEFRRRYEAMPHTRKAELLKGVVYVPSPVNLDHHGEPQVDLVTWIGVYRLWTPGLRAGDNTTARLGPEDEPQPDALLMIPRHLGGQAFVGVEGFLEGAPELAIEVASSSVSYDLHVKLHVYLEHGVREYLVWRVRDRAIDWFALRGEHYELLTPGAEGIIRSEVFPGLWLDPAALLGGDGARVLAVLQQGIASPEHAAFVQRLAAAQEQSAGAGTGADPQPEE
jgi:Uma2 family endonuclease